MRMNKRGRRGFTLLEIVVTVAILGILLAVAVPAFYNLERRNALRQAANRLKSNLLRAQQAAKTGREVAPNTRAQSAGVRVVSATQYVVFLDSDGLNNGPGTETNLEVVDVAREYNFDLSGDPLMRYQKNGTLAGNTDMAVIVRDVDRGEERTLNVAYGGAVELY